MQDEMASVHRLIDTCTGRFLSEDAAVKLAIERSLQDPEEHHKRMLRSYSLLGPRLRAKGVRRVEVPRDGNCQFTALVESGQLALTPENLRSQICSYIAHLPEVFGDHWDGWDNFEDYVSYMRANGSWGDHLTLLAAAHLLLRPIHVITDSTHHENAIHIVEPPDMISSELYGEPIVLIHFGENHYDATTPHLNHEVQ